MSGSGLDEIQEITPEREVPCARLIGVAGSGKTYTLLERQKADEYDLQLCATTGISAVNLGTITINSTLGYFDTASMRDAFLTGHLARKLHEIALEYQWLAVEEYSMLHADQLDILYRAAVEANRYADISSPLGLLLVGDLAQLPPVKGEWCFRADSWPRFAAHTTKLDKVWRQNGGPFLDALNLVRAGKGGPAAETLTCAGACWHTAVDTEFDGTTILPKNTMVNRYNDIALDRVPGSRFTVTSRRWGQQRSEWGENSRTHEWGIPPRSDFKLGAYVMILSNAPDFNYVNGDCGHIESSDADGIIIRMVRNQRVVVVPKLVRGVETSDRPDGFDGPRLGRDEDDGSWLPRVHYRTQKRRYVLGQVEYYPLRLAYASTVHKSQSLTLDRVQVDIRDHFFSYPAMCYVALSRVRTLEGLRIVGQRERFIQQVSTDPAVLPWI
jgi:ATP-dependent DNA helicase PIF1